MELIKQNCVCKITLWYDQAWGDPKDFTWLRMKRSAFAWKPGRNQPESEFSIAEYSVDCLKALFLWSLPMDYSNFEGNMF